MLPAPLLRSSSFAPLPIAIRTYAGETLFGGWQLAVGSRQFLTARKLQTANCHPDSYRELTHSRFTIHDSTPTTHQYDDERRYTTAIP